MRILVTGGAGFIGSNLVDALVARGDEVTVLDDLSTGSRANLNSRAKFFERDITDPNVFEGLGDFDALAHLAAKLSVQESFARMGEYQKVNVEGTRNVLEFARQHADRLVFASSCAVYGDLAPRSGGIPEDALTSPQSPYAEQKLEGERLCREISEQYKFPTVAMRFFNVYGPRMPRFGAYVGATRKFLDQKAAGEPLSIWGDGENSRDYVHVSDVVTAIIALITATRKPPIGGFLVFNVGTGVATTTNHLADLIVGPGYPRQHLPAVKEPRWLQADTRALQKITGWRPGVAIDDYDFSKVS